MYLLFRVYLPFFCNSVSFFVCICFFVFSVCTFYAFRHEVHFLVLYTFCFFLFCFVFFCTSLISFCNLFTLFITIFNFFALLKILLPLQIPSLKFDPLIYVHRIALSRVYFLHHVLRSFVFLFFFSLCLVDLQLLFLNTCQKVINGVG